MEAIIKYIALVFVTFFFMQVLTNKNKKISIVGTILVCCSSFIVYRGIPEGIFTGDINIKVLGHLFTVPYTIILGELAIIALNQFMTSENKIIKAISIIVISVIIGAFAFIDRGQIVIFKKLLIFTYIAMAVWVILKNKSKLKFNKWDEAWLIYFTISGIIIAVWTYLYGTELPESSAQLNQGNGLMHLFSYGYSMFLPFVNLGENAIYSSFLSVFPLSLILAMVYVYKKEKHLDFLMPMILVLVLQSVFCMTRLPLFKIIGWQSDWNMTLCVPAISLSCIYLYIYMIANIEENIFKLADSAKIVLALLVLYFIMPRPEIFMSKGYMYAISAVITLLYFMFINFADKRYQKVLLIVLVVWSLISTVPVLFVN